ncbi:hypothetical protein CTRI78_v005588 [Colletotrichum trifolii]|uniref:CFEM domain-containing protein n=1 Tax=Colletotrichum trifolii TaxID=5466 RepID=A0A4V3HW73_COLTR|nr:hypothetical protein CTRI78_v005588 [Colletotrichum trifolii]
MKYIIALSFLAGLVAAQSASQSASSADSTSLPSLVNQLPKCALGCLNDAATQIGCSATDFSCLCKAEDKLMSSLTPCVALAGCSTTELADAVEVAPKFCSAVEDNPSSAALASASNLVTAALGTATASAGTAATASASASASATPNAAVRRDYGMGMVGVAALAAAML